MILELKPTLTTVLKSSQTKTQSATLVAFSSSGKAQNEKTPPARIAHATLQKYFATAIQENAITGKFQETILYRQQSFEIFQNILVVGIGAKPSHEQVRQIAATVQASLKAANLNSINIDLDSLTQNKKEIAAFVKSFTEGLLLADYNFDELKSKKSIEKRVVMHAIIVTRHASELDVKRAFQEGKIVAESVNFSRRLGDLPGNHMTPTLLAKEIATATKGTGIRCEIWDKARIKKEKMGGLYGVSQGSDQEPRFIILRYNGGAKKQRPIAFVGKGLTFDSGGISLKPGAKMEEMKYDMCGGANVLGAVLAMAKLKLKVNVIALVPASENMPNGSATKPGDVHVARNGKSFEVNNTDAEGRLILADALCFASEQKPQMMVDAATLTGAIVVALGNIHTGFFTRDEALHKKIQNAAEVSGEVIWRMPLCDHHTKDIKGTYADLSNISSATGAGSATAAAFLEQFVEADIPWAHFDIAGTAWATGNRVNYNPKKGASGVMVRTFIELAKLYE